MNYLKRFLMVVAAIAATLIALVVLNLYRPAHFFQPTEMPPRFGPGGVELREVLSCGKDELPWGDPTKIEKVEIVGSVLKVTVLANATCGAVYPVEPRARIQDSNVELAWSWWSQPTDMVAACKCTRRIEFTVPNLAMEKLTVTIARDNAQTN